MDEMGNTDGVGLIIYSGSRDDLQRKLRARDDRIAELEAALRPFAGLADEIEHVAREAQTDNKNVAVHVPYAAAVAARAALSKSTS